MKVTTLNFIHRGKEEIKFSYDVNVSKDGTFSTTLPKEAVGKIEAYGVNLVKTARLSNYLVEPLERKEKTIKEQRKVNNSTITSKEMPKDSESVLAIILKDIMI